MEIEQIVRELETHTEKLPRAALEAATAAREQITPELIRIVQEAARNLDGLLARPEYAGHIFAMYLLAEFREQRAYPAIIEFFSTPGEDAKEVTGDVVTEDLGRILASVCHGDTVPIRGLVENREVDEFVRNAGLDALMTLFANGMQTREEVVAYFQSLFRGRLEREPSAVWNGLVSSATSLYPEELLADIERAFQEGLVEEFFIGLGDVRDRLARGRDRVLADARSHWQYQLIRSAADELATWDSFKESPPLKPSPAPTAAQSPSASLPAPRVAARPPAPKARKVGRNEPCPCGSGKKYKRCCGR